VGNTTDSGNFLSLAVSDNSVSSAMFVFAHLFVYKRPEPPVARCHIGAPYRPRNDTQSTNPNRK